MAKGPCLPYGDFVVVWQVDNVDSTSNIYARGFLMDGSELFPSMAVNSDKEGRHSFPAIAKNVACKFVVVWQSDNGNGYSNIYARGFNLDGTTLFPEIIVTSILSDQQLSPVTDFTLFQNYPNPCNPRTKIKYQLPELSFVTLKVYDVLGNEITTLVNQEKSVGNYEVEFSGSGLTSGIYFYKLQAGDFVETKKMVFMK